MSSLRSIRFYFYNTQKYHPPPPPSNNKANASHVNLWPTRNNDNLDLPEASQRIFPAR